MGIEPLLGKIACHAKLFKDNNYTCLRKICMYIRRPRHF